MEPDREPRVRRSVRIPNWTTIALIAGLIVLVLLIAYFATSRNPNQDKLTDQQLTQGQEQAKAPAPEKVCASRETYDLIKRELFRRAAQLRGSDQAAFDQLSSYAVLRMENPVMESQGASTHAVNCSGTLSLDLPPGVGIVGSRRTLTSDVDYTVQPAADGSGNVVLLRNADAIIAPLTTLARVNETPAPAPQQAPATPEETNEAMPEQPQAAPAVPEQQPLSAVPSQSGPSFDCKKAHSRGEIAVCSHAGLAALDRNMATQYRQAMQEATPQQQALLRRTRDRFIGYRDRCPNRSCIGDAYVGRMREIRDIMEGRWQPQH
jgi:uncharacterized protein YecT (DUF1311 family)